MIDTKLETFIKLSETLSYTKTAELLNLTQPAITKQIKLLENLYNKKLFTYYNRKLSLTKEGFIFLEYAKKVYSLDNQLDKLIRNNKKTLNFGCTLTIGEYKICNIITQYLIDNPDIQISMIIDNTENMLKAIDNGNLDFALVEGYFDKDKYNYALFNREEFIAIMAPDNELRNTKNIKLIDIKNQNLIIREQGSGSREILMNALHEQLLSIDHFNNTYEIGSINVIKEMVKRNLGISFLYKATVLNELKDKSLITLEIDDLQLTKEFNFIYNKESLNEVSALNFYKYAINFID